MAKTGFIYKKWYDKIRYRIKTLPSLQSEFVDSFAKKNALSVKKAFEDGISNDTLDLVRLKPKTIEQKKRRGYTKPETPLYGMGGDNPRAYKNMLIIRKIKTGYRLSPSWRKHHSANVSLKKLFYVHEFGAEIDNGKCIIKIPAREALAKSYRAWKVEAKEKIGKELQSALIYYINTGKMDKLQRMIKDVT